MTPGADAAYLFMAAVEAADRARAEEEAARLIGCSADEEAAREAVVSSMIHGAKVCQAYVYRWAMGRYGAGQMRLVQEYARLDADGRAAVEKFAHDLYERRRFEKARDKAKGRAKRR